MKRMMVETWASKDNSDEVSGRARKHWKLEEN
jgi:hypothetical protein